MQSDELVDLVDASGEIKKRGMRRGEVKVHKEELLAQGLYQPIVIVVVVDDEGKVIAQVRGGAKVGDGQGAVDHVCGVIAAGEVWDQTARREAAEEISVELKDLIMVDQRVNGFGRHRTLAVARAVGAPMIGNSDEVADIFLASPDELQAMAKGDRVFIDGFFTDLHLALARLVS